MKQARISSNVLVEKILADRRRVLSGRKPKYRTASEQLAAGGELMDLLLPTGKTLRESTFAECEAVGNAWLAVDKIANWNARSDRGQRTPR